MTNQYPTPPAPSPPADLPPVLLGLGKVTRLLGEGGVAWVYEVFNGRLCVHRAVKVLKPGLSSEAHDRFRREMRLMPSLTHQHIVRVFSAGESPDGQLYIEMERLLGPSLQGIIDSRGPLGAPATIALGIAVCAGLQFAHSHVFTINGRRRRGILHRDLKPANILLSDMGIVKLTDFGASQPIDHRAPIENQTFFGSLQYVAPEDLRGERVDVRADIYSLGCVLFEALTGGRLFPQAAVEELIGARMANDHRAALRLRGRAPKRLIALIDRCLRADPAERFGAAIEVDAALTELWPRRGVATPERELRRLTESPAPLRLSAFHQTGAMLVASVRTFRNAMRGRRTAK